MTPQPPARRQNTTHAARAAEPFLAGKTRFPAPVREALDRYEEALTFEHQQARLTALLRDEVMGEWLAAKKAHDQHEADTKAPADFTPFDIPEPPLEIVSARSRLYKDARARAGRDLDRSAQDNLARVWATLEKAWAESVHPTIEDTMTIAQAAAAESVAAEARRALGQVCLWLCITGGASDLERRTVQTAIRAGDLLSLDQAQAMHSGKAERDATIAEIEAQREARKAEAIRTSSTVMRNRTAAANEKASA